MVNKKRKRPTRSWVYRWGVVEGRYWLCSLCPNNNRKSFVNASTTHIIEHLTQKHGKTDTTAELSQTTLTAYRPIDKDTLTQLVTNWVIQAQQPFTVIESATFRAILQYVNPYAIRSLPKCGDTIRNQAVQQFNDAKHMLISAIAKARSRIHLSFDLWTSPNYKAVIGIVGHWTAEDYSLKTVLLAIREIHGPHNGYNIGTKIFEVIEEYGFASKVGYCVTDNATNNDTALKVLAESLLEIHSIIYDVDSHRLRCLGHIINLVVKALLFESSISADTSPPNVLSGSGDGYTGALRKLHNVVHHIRITPQRRHIYYSEQAASLESCSDFMVVADNATRWNSTYTMVKSALLLQERIDGYIRLVGSELEDDQLSNEDWTDLAELNKILVPFEKITLAAQGNNQGQGSIVSVLLSMDMLLTRLETIKEQSVAVSSTFQLSVDAAWAKLNKYYSLTERSPIYVVATILHPCMKMKYFQRHWQDRQDWIDAARSQMNDYFLQYYENSTPIETDITRSEIDEWCFGSLASTESELEQYLNAPTVILRGDDGFSTFNIVHWWQGNEHEYPTLSKIAYDIFAVPAMSAEAERVFSRYVPIIYFTNCVQRRKLSRIVETA